MNWLPHFTGQLEPLVDIDISKGYQENVTLTFINKSEVKFTETVSVRVTVCNLKALIAERMQLTVGWVQMIGLKSGLYLFYAGDICVIHK